MRTNTCAPHPKRANCLNQWWSLQTLEDNQRVEFDTMQGQKGPQAANVLLAKVGRRTYGARDWSQTAGASASGAIITPDG
jgi:'Cold-shock' DNA-binding domain